MINLSVIRVRRSRITLCSIRATTQNQVIPFWRKILYEQQGRGQITAVLPIILRNLTSLRKLHVKSYGCQMNVYDANRMTDLLTSDSSYVETSVLEDADLVILNTSHIREKAADKVYSELARIRKLTREAPRSRRHPLVSL